MVTSAVSSGGTPRGFLLLVFMGAPRLSGVVRFSGERFMVFILADWSRGLCGLYPTLVTDPSRLS
jgi:hypothetical protein